MTSLSRKNVVSNVNINEIARRAGVSRATVSRYLNDGYVSQQKRELIARVIEETGYVPSQRAQQLRTGRTQLVGVVIPKINSQSVSRMVAGITATLASRGYQTVLASTENNEQVEVDYMETFSKRSRLDGIILIGTVLTSRHREAIAELNMPLVVLAQKSDVSSCVYQDDYHAMHDITSLVLAKAKSPAYLGVFEEDVAAGLDRHRGFLDACAQAGIEPAPEAQLVVGFDADAGYFGAEQLLDTIEGLDTIVCATDDIAFGAMMCMMEYGKRVPEDVQITGVGDSLLSRISRPSLTTVHLPYKTAGQRAAESLLCQINTGVRDNCHIVMPYEVYVRNSMR